jgi:hypothetical protein
MQTMVMMMNNPIVAFGLAPEPWYRTNVPTAMMNAIMTMTQNIYCK